MHNLDCLILLFCSLNLILRENFSFGGQKENRERADCLLVRGHKDETLFIFATLYPGTFGRGVQAMGKGQIC